jgi:hypothetical protein
LVTNVSSINTTTTTTTTTTTIQFHGVSIHTMEAAVKSFLAYYLEQAPKLKMDAIDIIQETTILAGSLGLSKLPTISTKTAKRMGIEHLITTNDYHTI